MQLRAIFFILCTSIPTITMERINRDLSNDCDIENQNQKLVTLSDSAIISHSPERIQATKIKCINKSNTYCDLLANLKQLPDPYATSIYESIKQDICEWESVVQNSEYDKMQNLFERFSQTFIKECKINTVPLFNNEEVTMCGFKRGVNQRSFTLEFAVQLKHVLEKNDLDNIKNIAFILKKWHLYFSHLNDKAQSLAEKKIIRETAFSLSPIPLSVISLITALKDYQIISYTTLGLSCAAVLGTQIAIRKFGVLCANTHLRISEEIAQVQSSLAAYQSVIALQKTKISSAEKIKQAVKDFEIKLPITISFKKEIETFDSLCNDSTLDYQTNITAIKKQKAEIIKIITNSTK